MNRGDSIRDKLVYLTEYSNPQKPCNVKRKSIHKQSFKTNPSKLSMQDFVRMDPCYTTDIEHLVFPTKKSLNQPVASNTTAATGKTRSRLAEMFALSRHLQQKSADRESKLRNLSVNRSVDSALEVRKVSSNRPGSIAGTRTSEQNSRRWATTAVEEPVRQNSAVVSSGTRISATAADTVGMSTARGPNVSILHLRSTSDPWEVSPTSVYPSSYKQCSTGRSNSAVRSLTKHQSLISSNQNSKWNPYAGFHSGEEVNSTDLFVTGTCSRELSPVRWCDREVDGVYLGRSGWVQVQQRSLDENRRVSYTAKSSTAPIGSRRTGIKLAQYHCMSEPGKCPEIKTTDYQRPLYLPLQKSNYERRPDPPPPPPPSHHIPESYSPPSITPIISPPPAFQDRNQKNLTKSRTFFGKTPFLPRSDAIEDSDGSPPNSPLVTKKPTTLITAPIKTVTSPVTQKTYGRIPQTKSLEDTTNRRNQFTQRFVESSSSSSSSMGFRSLDSCVSRPAMPRLSENTDSSVEVYEDADDEDNNSSLSLVSSVIVNVGSKTKEKLSPSSRANRHKQLTKKSPVGSDNNKLGKTNSSSDFSSSSPEYHSRSPSNTSVRRLGQKVINRTPPQEDTASLQRVRRSRSLQLPEKKNTFKEQIRISPQPNDHRLKKPVNQPQKLQSLDGKYMDENLLREAEVVTEFLYGSRSRAAAQALLKHRYNNGLEEPGNLPPKIPPGNGYNVFYVPPNQTRISQPAKVLQRGATTPVKNESCNSQTCDFWPHCGHRIPMNHAQPSMKVSQSYPTHQRSLDINDGVRATVLIDRSPQDVHNKKRVCGNVRSFSEIKPDYPVRTNVSVSVSRVSPKKTSAGSGSEKNSRHPSPNIGNSSASSSSSDVWVTTSDRTIAKSPKNKSSGASTPIGSITMCPVRENILTRPGSAPAEDRNNVLLEAQQRSLSLPKSFLSASSCIQSGQVSWNKRGTESLRSSPGACRKGAGSCHAGSETSHTAPVTPSHEIQRRRSPVSGVVRRPKATSTPQLLDPPEIESDRLWNEKIETNEEPLSRLTSVDIKDVAARRNLNSESVLQKFRKTFGLRFQKKGSKENCSKESENVPEVSGEPSEEDSPLHILSNPAAPTQISNVPEEPAEQKYRFGPLTWRTSKERKKMNKAARSAKCNSGDSGIQIEMAPGCGAGGDSSESHDTDPPGDELDSPPALRRRPPNNNKSSRPHSDLLNQILIDKFKAELKSRAHKHNQVRRTHSDLGGQRLLHWDPRSSYRRLMSSPAPMRGRPQSPRKKPPDIPGGVQLRPYPRKGNLRRSLSQPLDIDKLSPLMRTKTAGIRIGGINVLSEDEHDGRGTSDDEMMLSDSESSIASLTERKKSLELAMDEDVVILAEAVFDHVAIEAEELAFRAGDVIEVLETVNRDWWWGSADGKSGWFPAAFVRLRVSQEDTVEDCLAAMASGNSVPSHLRRRTSISLLSNDQVRTSIVRELVNTERDFVKVLRDVAEGYIAECRKRKDMFTKDQIDTIFINLEEILKFQLSFLKDLEACIDWETPHKSCVGSCFLKHSSGFTMYSDYCNSHPVATATLQELYQFNNYSKFFEACRLMRGLIEIPLDGYLLTPVQRICKYPLQLAELLKYTKTDHPDCKNIREALQAMKEVAVLINERKRRMESLEKLAAWQLRAEGWEGEDLIETSSQLIHQGEVIRIKTGMWTNHIMLFLFDHQVVYCKKDILKKNTYVYKGRLCLDTTEVIDIPDGKDIHIGVTVRHAIKLYSCLKDKWLLFCCRTSTEKQKWLQAFSEERKLVAQDKDDGLEFPPAARQLARVAARCQRRPPRKPRGSKNYKRDSAYMGSTLQLNSNSLGRRMGTWFTFGGNKKSRHQHRDIS